MKHINIRSWKPSRIRTRMWFTHWYSSRTLRFQKLFDPVQLCERFMHLKLQILIFYSNIPQQEGSVEYLNFHTFPQALLCWHCRITLLPRCFGYQWDGARPRLECFKMCGGNTKLWNIISQHLPKEKTCTANQYTRTHCSRVINSFQRGSGARQTSKLFDVLLHHPEQRPANQSPFIKYRTEVYPCCTECWGAEVSITHQYIHEGASFVISTPQPARQYHECTLHINASLLLGTTEEDN